LRYLADTHAVVWWAEDSSRLSRRARTVFAAKDSEIWWSIAGAWELAIKHSLGRLELSVPLSDLVHVHLPRQGIEILPVGTEHVLRLAQLPHHHSDPFDRMLVAQAQAENLILISRDPEIRSYDVDVVW
jgi:PIN domain nuclease of toxin-antitoxin system